MEKKFKAQEKRNRRVERKNASENPEIVAESWEAEEDADASDELNADAVETSRHDVEKTS